MAGPRFGGAAGSWANLAPTQAPSRGYRVVSGSVWWRLIFWPWRQYLVWCLNNGFTIINLLQDLLNFLGPYKRFSVLIV